MLLYDLVAKITLDTKEYEENTKKADKEGRSLGERLKSGLATIGKVTAGAIASGAAAISALTKQSVSAYANYEQLVGGVDKLFGAASGKLQQYAAEAYKTAGMSANQYMEQATSFSAALINSLGGDTAKAADIADIAMRAMSDNVNTFGTDMESVQAAFQGFAKQNYTINNLMSAA